jgi:hypothetical protein
MEKDFIRVMEFCIAGSVTNNIQMVSLEKRKRSNKPV